MKKIGINIANTTRSSSMKRSKKFKWNQDTLGHFGERDCVWCGEMFSKPTAVSKICSDECRKLYMREYYRERDARNRKNPEWVAKRQKQHRDNYHRKMTNPEYVERINKEAREKYATDPTYKQKKIESVKKSSLKPENAERIKKYQKEYRKRNKNE